MSRILLQKKMLSTKFIGWTICEVPEYKMKKYVPNNTECQTMIGCGFPADWMTGFGFKDQGWLIIDSIPFIAEKNRISVRIASASRIGTNSNSFNITMEPTRLYLICPSF